MNYRIGIFDSGVGGLTVAKAIFETCNNIDIIYLGDSKHVPYGNKSVENILQYSINNTEWLISKKVDLIIIACNTANAVAYAEVIKKSKVPVIGVIENGVRAILETTKSHQIGIIGTYRTIESDIYRKKLLEKTSKKTSINLKIHQKACPLFVPIIEEGITNLTIINSVIEEYLSSFIDKIDTLLLGCTHYPFLKSYIKEKYPHCEIIDSAQSTAIYLNEFLKENHLQKQNNQNTCSIYSNDINEVFIQISKKIFPTIEVQKVEN